MEKQSDEIQFRPLHEGLGFHPFSEGLPYSPSVSKPRSSGTGAVSAGAPVYARALPKMPAPAPIVPQPQIEAPVAILELKQFGAGYLFRRVAAYTLDTILNVLLAGAALGWVLWKQNIEPELFMKPELLLAMGLFILFFSWALITAQEIAFGSSAAKRAFGLSVPGSALHLLLRSTLFLVGVSFCGIGLVWAVFDKNRRCWHDIASGTQPQ